MKINLSTNPSSKTKVFFTALDSDPERHSLGQSAADACATHIIFRFSTRPRLLAIIYLGIFVVPLDTELWL